MQLKATLYIDGQITDVAVYDDANPKPPKRSQALIDAIATGRQISMRVKKLKEETE